LQLSLDSPDFDCVATLSVIERSTSGATPKTIAVSISTTLNNLIVSNPSFASEITLLNIFSTEASNTINLTLQLRDKSNTVFGIAKADIPAGGRFALNGDGVLSISDSSGGGITPPGP
jgi:hypothetical protein